MRRLIAKIYNWVISTSVVGFLIQPPQLIVVEGSLVFTPKLRVEMTSQFYEKDGQMYVRRSYGTLRAMACHLWSEVVYQSNRRALFELNPSRYYMLNPQRGAIAYDASTGGTNTGVSSLTISHTCTGSNGLVAGLNGGQGNTAVTSMTFDGTTLTNAVSQATNASVYISYLKNPASGSAKNLVINFGGVNSPCGSAISFSGVDQTTPVGASNSATGTSTTPSVSLTTSYDSSMIVDGVGVDSGGSNQSPTATGTNQTRRISQAASAFNEQACSTTTTTTAGSYTLSYSMGASKAWDMCALEIKQAVATSLPKSYIFKQAVNRASTY